MENSFNLTPSATASSLNRGPITDGSGRPMMLADAGTVGSDYYNPVADALNGQQQVDVYGKIQRYGFCATCHGSLNGDWINVAGGRDQRPLPFDQYLAIQRANQTARELEPLAKGLAIVGASVLTGGIASGFVGGALTAYGVSAGTTAILSGFAGGATGAFTGDAIAQLSGDQPFSWSQSAWNTSVGGATGGLAGGALHGLRVVGQDIATGIRQWMNGPTPALMTSGGTMTSTGAAAIPAIGANPGTWGGLLGTNVAYASQQRTPEWRRYEIEQGGKQTSMSMNVGGKTVRVRLDKPPSKSTIVDFKHYDWNNPAYKKPFIQKIVGWKFQAQIRLYKMFRKHVHLQFSQQPPPWATDAIHGGGGTYSVVP